MPERGRMVLEMSPYHGLGKLEQLHQRLKQLNCPASNYGLVLFAADHQISEYRFSNYEPLASNLIVEKHLLGLAPTTRMLRRLGKREYILDVGMARPITARIQGELEKIQFAGKYAGFSSGTAELVSYGIETYSRDFVNEDALTMEEVKMALTAGKDYCHILSDKNFDIIGIGEIGVGNTLCSAAMASVAMGVNPEKLVGRGSSTAEVIERKIEIICRALKNRNPQSDNIFDIIARFGGLEIAALVGFISAAADNNLPVIMDGYVTAVAGYLASMINKRVPEVLIAPSLADQIGHGLILQKLGLEAMFDLNINYGEGLAAAFGLFLAESTEIFYN